MAALTTCIVPCFNGERFLGAAIDSVLAQDYRPVEIIVIDDGSADDSVDIAEAYGDPVRVIRAEHRGIAAARNAGILASHGEYLGFLDADDLYLPGKLSAQVAALEADPGIDYCLCIAENFWEAGLEAERDRYSELGKVRATHHPGAMLARRSAFDRIGLLDTRRAVGDDIDWFLRAADAGLEGSDPSRRLLRPPHACSQSLARAREPRSVPRSRQGTHRSATQGRPAGRSTPARALRPSALAIRRESGILGERSRAGKRRRRPVQAHNPRSSPRPDRRALDRCRSVPHNLMRVLYFVERFWPFIGGVEVMTARVLPPLARRGIEITIVTSQDDLELPERDQIDGVAVRRLPFGDAVRSSNLDAVIEMRQRIGALRQEVQPDLVHMVFTGPGIYFPVTTAHISPAPTLLSFHGSWPLADLERHSLLRQAIGISAWLTACSNSALADLRALGQGIEHRSSTILNGLDPSFEPSELRFDPPVLLCAARLVPEKGLDIAIAALALVRRAVPDGAPPARWRRPAPAGARTSGRRARRCRRDRVSGGPVARRDRRARRLGDRRARSLPPRRLRTDRARRHARPASGHRGAHRRPAGGARRQRGNARRAGRPGRAGKRRQDTARRPRARPASCRSRPATCARRVHASPVRR